MHETPADGTQRIYARVAGLLYLFNYVAVVFGQLAPARIRGSGDFADTAQRVLASEHLYRSALTSMAIGWLSVVILAFALYVTLEPVGKRLAQLALFMRLGEAFIGSVTVMLSFATVRLRLHAAQPSGAFQDDQLQVLVSVVGAALGSGFQIAMAFLGVGSALFFWLFYRSRCIPRPLAALGVLASIVMLIVSVASLTFPAHAGTLQYGWVPMAVAEIGTALWLVIRGIRAAPLAKDC